MRWEVVVEPLQNGDQVRLVRYLGELASPGRYVGRIGVIKRVTYDVALVRFRDCFGMSAEWYYRTDCLEKVT